METQPVDLNLHFKHSDDCNGRIDDLNHTRFSGMKVRFVTEGKKKSTYYGAEVDGLHIGHSTSSDSMLAIKKKDLPLKPQIQIKRRPAETPLQSNKKLKPLQYGKKLKSLDSLEGLTAINVTLTCQGYQDNSTTPRNPKIEISYQYGDSSS